MPDITQARSATAEHEPERLLAESQDSRFRWWKLGLGLLAVWQLADFSFALARWIGLIALLALLALATAMRNRARWVARGIEATLGLALLIQISLIFARDFLAQHQTAARFVEVFSFTVAGLLGVGLVGTLLSKRRRKLLKEGQ